MNFCRITNTCLSPLDKLGRKMGEKNTPIKVFKAGPFQTVLLVFIGLPIIYGFIVPLGIVIYVIGSTGEYIIPKRIQKSIKKTGEIINKWVDSRYMLIRRGYNRKFVHFCPDFVSENQFFYQEGGVEVSEINTMNWEYRIKLNEFCQGLKYGTKCNVSINIEVVE